MFSKDYTLIYLRDKCVVSPAARLQVRELMWTTLTFPWLILVITWCRQFPSLSNNILLIKSKLKLGSTTIAVRDAMMPWHHVTLGASIAVSSTPGPECARTIFCANQSLFIELHQSGVIPLQQCRRSCVVFESWISVARCPFQWQWRGLHSFMGYASLRSTGIIKFC